MLISAGFDGLATDPLGGQLSLGVADYEWLTKELVKLADECCGGRVVSVLEGGYDVDPGTDGLASAVQVHVKTLMSAGCE